MSDTGIVPAAEAAELLANGAVLPPGTEGGGERAVPLTARAYRHPGLDDRVVVRLVAAELGAAEDLAAGFLGLVPDGEPAEVGIGLRQSLGFPEWVLVHHPADGHHALGVVPELDRIARQARTKPKAALDAYQLLAGQLAAAVPHFLPTFYEQAGRVFLGVENATYAAQMFTRARRAEAEHGLTVDEDRLDGVFLEFALAGALPVKVMSGYAKELAARVPAPEAFGRFRRLCVRRTAGGLQPAASMAGELRKLAKAAGLDPVAEEGAYLAELLALPATLRAAAGWWKAHGPALAALARREPAVRGTLLDLMPTNTDAGLPGLWLEVLESSGATAGLCDAALPAEERPGDGASGWFRRFLAFRGRGWYRRDRLPGLYPLVELMADRLRAELAASGEALPVTDSDVDLLDLLLTLGVPVADPKKDTTLNLVAWAEHEDRRELVALEADARFRPAFRSGADRLGSDRSGTGALRALTRSPGGRPMLTEWVRGVVSRFSAAGLPRLPDELGRLAWLPGWTLALAEEEARAAARTDLTPALVRTLRAGLFDELGWPAWEEAAAALVPAKDIDDLVVADAWPYLITSGSSQVRVLGTEGTVLTHDLRIPADDRYGNAGCHYVDGELLVQWRSRAADGGLRGYWQHSADRQRTMEGPEPRGTRVNWLGDLGAVTLPLPGGGRTTGRGVVHRGDSAVPHERPVISDGHSLWVWGWQEDYHSTVGWYEYDPVTGERGRRSMPGFLADATRTAPAGSTFRTGWVLPAPSAEAGPGGSPVDGLLGWRVVELADGSFRGEDLAGTTVTVPAGIGQPARALLFPGSDRPTAVVQNNYTVSLVDQDGVVTTTAKTDNRPGTFAAGTLVLPPLRHWHCLRPRDPQGSGALRRLDGATAAGLLTAAAEEQKRERANKADKADPLALPALVRELLPQVSHDALVTGIVSVVRFAATQQLALDAVAERLDKDLAVGRAEDTEPTGPADPVLREALNGLGLVNDSWWGAEGSDLVCRQLRFVGQQLRDPAEPDPAVRLHLDGPELPWARLNWTSLPDLPATAAFRAASVTTAPDHRETLGQLLRELDAQGLAVVGPDRWRRFELRLDGALFTAADGRQRATSTPGLLRLGSGAFLAFVNDRADTGSCEFTALFHDPAGQFEVPAPYTVVSSAPVGQAGDPGRLGAFLTELTERGPAPWFPEAAEEFSRLTGVTGTTARLIVAGLPQMDVYGRSFLPTEARTAIGVKVADAALAKDELGGLKHRVRRAVVAALLPAEPARLWTDGPDVRAAAEVWNARVGRRAAVPEALLTEAARAVRTNWRPSRCLPALLDPAGERQLSRDLEWQVSGDRVAPVGGSATGFTAGTLFGAVTLSAWLAHRLPAGDPIRAALPAALTAVRERLAHPGLMLDLNRYVSLPDFRKVAGAPTETGEGYERYGAVVMATADNQPSPGIRPALLDAAGHDPYLAALRADDEPFPAEAALRIAHDPRFEALLAGPGDPSAGERDKEGVWWPQDPARSVPDLVGEAAKEYGIGEDAAVLYLMLLAMPDPTDRNTARWSGWPSRRGGAARLKAARAELAATDLVVEAGRARAGRSLFLPGGWTDPGSPVLPLEQWKLPLYGVVVGGKAALGVIVPTEPVADLYRRAWRRVREGDGPRFQELKVRRGRRH
ncbi:DNA-binding protein [Streptomyces sp. NBC_01498]|uniref:DNA-binding protein n=1 Tax=Streptomyces sp. NBC_01498 TaxID=2975870 RepID=UPI002E7C4023|nr:DNA-binding protein [Streptomyces sp. NBC_01498]WTL24133.1 DNA-binding protein [Streptomyces sp. NBC_01498]